MHSASSAINRRRPGCNYKLIPMDEKSLSSTGGQSSGSTDSPKSIHQAGHARRTSKVRQLFKSTKVENNEGQLLVPNVSERLVLVPNVNDRQVLVPNVIERQVLVAIVNDNVPERKEKKKSHSERAEEHHIQLRSGHSKGQPSLNLNGHCSSSVWRRRTRYLLPLLLLVVYSASGGLLFWFLEGPTKQAAVEEAKSSLHEPMSERKNYSVSNLIQAMEVMYYGRIMKWLGRNCIGKENQAVAWNSRYCCIDLERISVMKNRSFLFAAPVSVHELLANYTRPPTAPAQEHRRDWTFWGSIFYCGTVYTTIGYGYITAETDLGRAFTVVYALFGIPLVLYNLSQLGSLLMRLIWKCYIGALTMKDMCKTRRKGTTTRIAKRDMAEFPFWIAISITITWTLMCSALFQIWEEWDFFTSFYFFFQSLTTIGFGDVKPSYPERLVWSFFLILIGLALVSMCWSLLQMKFDHMITTASRKIRDRFVNTSLDDGEMATDSTSIEREIEKITSNENALLANLVGDDRRQALVNEWRKRAKMKNVACSTDTHMDEKGCQTEEDERPNVVTWNVPYRETRRPIPYSATAASLQAPCNDDFRGLLHSLKSILGECRETLSNTDSAK